MRLAFSNIAWTPGDDGAVARMLRNVGVEGVEIAPTAVWSDPLQVGAADVEAYRRRWAEEGLSVVALQALLYGHPELQVFGAPAVQSATLAHLDGMFVLAARLGARALVFGSPRNRTRGAMAPDEAFERGVEFFARAGAMARARGVQLCIEPNPPQYDCDFITTSAEAVRLVTAVGETGFAIHLDGGALTLNGEEPLMAVRSAGASLAHFHASEPFLVPLGDGATDHAQCSLALRSVSYDGWISVEMRRAVDGDPLDRLRRASETFAAFYAAQPSASGTISQRDHAS
jgi:D-psicose/D-tagatose/L-ribulose 3-epimerase